MPLRNPTTRHLLSDGRSARLCSCGCCSSRSCDDVWPARLHRCTSCLRRSTLGLPNRSRTDHGPWYLELLVLPEINSWFSSERARCNNHPAVHRRLVNPPLVSRLPTGSSFLTARTICTNRIPIPLDSLRYSLRFPPAIALKTLTLSTSPPFRRS